MTEFGMLTPDGEYVVIRTISSMAMQACPYVIFDPSHYREDETCRCGDPTHTEMTRWGYKWNGERWVEDPDWYEEG